MTYRQWMWKNNKWAIIFGFILVIAYVACMIDGIIGHKSVVGPIINIVITPLIVTFLTYNQYKKFIIKEAKELLRGKEDWEL